MTRSIILALPTEIDTRSKIQLVRKFVRENFTEIGMIADLSIHQIDCDNPYAYILLTMQVSIVTPTGEIQFVRKIGLGKIGFSADRSNIDRPIKVF